MDLYLRREDLEDVLNVIRNKCALPDYYGDLYARKNSYLQKDSMQFGLGEYDRALFYHDHPYDSDEYHSIPVHSLYEELLFLKEHKLDEKDMIYEPEALDGNVINIGRMIERREQQREAIAVLDWEARQNVKDEKQTDGEKQACDKDGTKAQKEFKQHNIKRPHYLQRNLSKKTKKRRLKF
jgi:hypothetical protein